MPVRTTPVTPGVLSVLQPPLSCWVLLRYLTALSTVWSQVLGSGPGFVVSPEGSADTVSTTASPRVASAVDMFLIRYLHAGIRIAPPHASQTECRMRIGPCDGESGPANPEPRCRATIDSPALVTA